MIPDFLNRNYYKLFFIITFFLNIITEGGQTGKITGRVTDKKTGEGVFGANVVVEKSTIGAAAEIDGHYIILGIPPGQYSLSISAIGYKKTKITDVLIVADKTTSVDIQLEEETVVGQEVVVKANRPIIQKDLTSSELSVSSTEINNLPVESLGDILQMKAGVVTDATGSIHIRGGRSSEVGYLIDGISVTDKYSGSQSSSVDVQFIEEVKVISGVFNAEYGQAMSGIVEIITKQAQDKFSGNISLSSGDYLSSSKSLFMNIDKINPVSIYDLKGNITGPINLFGEKISYNIAGRSFYNEGYLYGKRKFNPSDSSFQQGGVYYINSSGDGKIVSMNPFNNYNFQVKLSYDPVSFIKLSNLFIYDYSQSKYYNHLFKYNPDGVPTNYNTSFNNIASLTFLLSANTFITAKYSFRYSQAKSDVYEDLNDERYANPELLRQLSAYSFLTGGTIMDHNLRETYENTFKIDLLSQIDKYNEFKTGIELNYSLIDLNNRTAEYQDTIKVFDFNRYLNEGIFEHKPLTFAAYVQDKIEFESIIINAGIRFDYFNSNGKIPVNYRSPELSSREKANAQYQLSPRLGVAFPISADGTLHFSYGHFFQIPNLEYLYTNPNYRVGPGGLYTLMGNANLKAQSTVAYEVGLHYQFFNMFGLEITGFYKDISNLLGTEIKDTDIRTDRYALYVNRDYGRSKGFTLSLTKQNTTSDNISFTLDYTFQIAEGNASDPTDAFTRAQGNPPMKPNIQVVPLNWDQTHTINISLFYTIQGNLNIGLVAKYESGFPFTPEYQSIVTSLENSARMPSKVNVDLQVNKDISLFGVNFSLFARVFNLFDVKNEINVYKDTGRAGYSLVSQYNPEEQGANTLTEYLSRPDYYSEPRRILFGIAYNINL
jgi:outer membrane receptor for ferrienterochelin and colicin